MLILLHTTDGFRSPIINLDHLHTLAQQAHVHDAHKEAAKDGFLVLTCQNHFQCSLWGDSKASMAILSTVRITWPLGPATVVILSFRKSMVMIGSR